MNALKGIEARYCDVCVGAVIAAWRNLVEMTASEALQKVKYGKSDTLGLDATPEIIISQRLTDFDGHCFLVTEELDDRYKANWPTDSDPIRQPLMFFSDPTDRSKQLKAFLAALSKDKPLTKIGELWKEGDCVKKWEDMFEAPASITGATSSITCVRKGAIIFSVIFNYLTQTLFVACASGVYQLKWDEGMDVDLAYVLKKGAPVKFPSAAEVCKRPDEFKRFVTFLGKSGYTENFNDSMLFVDKPDDFLHHQQPGGPSRPLYLSELQVGHGPVGFIMANGEKIGEWIHWLSFVKFAREVGGGPALRAFEISLERPWTKEGILMSTSAPYSLFHGDGERKFLDISRLRNFEHPSRFRSMLVVMRSDNEIMGHIMQKHCYREVGGLF